MKKTLRLVSLVLVVCIFALTLTACTPSSIDAAKNKMINAGYSIEDYNHITTDNELGGIYAYKGSVTNRISITAVLYETKEDAVNAVNNSFTEWTADGKWIYKGDAEAIEAFTK